MRNLLIVAGVLGLMVGCGAAEDGVPGDDPEGSGGSAKGGMDPSGGVGGDDLVIASFIVTYPAFGVAVTDVAGIRNMNVLVTAILLEGDLQSDTTPIYVADGGTVTLYRNDGLYDLEGALKFTEVSGLGASPMAVTEPKTIDLKNFYFEYDVGFL